MSEYDPDELFQRLLAVLPAGVGWGVEASLCVEGRRLLAAGDPVWRLYGRRAASRAAALGGAAADVSGALWGVSQEPVEGV